MSSPTSPILERPPVDALGRPPGEVCDELAALAGALTAVVPAKADDNWLIATWNLRAFGSLTRKWLAGRGDSPKRDLRGLSIIVEVLSRFEPVAIQEVKGDLRALRVGHAPAGRRFSLPHDGRDGRPGGQRRAPGLPLRPPARPALGPGRRARRAPRASPRPGPHRKERPHRAVRAHALRDELPPRRRDGDLRHPPRPARGRAGRAPLGAAGGGGLAPGLGPSDPLRGHRRHHDLVALGDFNIDRAGSPLHDAFVSTGLTVPDALLDLPRTIFDDPGEPSDDHFYDQLAWFTEGRRALLSMEPRTGGNFDFQPHAYRGTGLSRREISWRVSDHLPLWVEFGV